VSAGFRACLGVFPRCAVDDAGGGATSSTKLSVASPRASCAGAPGAELLRLGGRNETELPFAGKGLFEKGGDRADRSTDRLPRACVAAHARIPGLRGIGRSDRRRCGGNQSLHFRKARPRPAAARKSQEKVHRIPHDRVGLISARGVGVPAPITAGGDLSRICGNFGEDARRTVLPDVEEQSGRFHADHDKGIR
jgi:hypothetical protein